MKLIAKYAMYQLEMDCSVSSNDLRRRLTLHLECSGESILNPERQLWAEVATRQNVAFGSNPALRRVRYGRPVWACERTLPLALPVDRSMT